MRNLRWLIAVLAAVAIAPIGAAAQQGTITGQVVDETTRQPLPDVQIFVEGTTRGTLTNAQGRYQLVGIPVGTTTLRATRIGYNQSQQQVTVAAGAQAVANFSLTPAAVELGAVVVTATGERQTKRELGNAVGSINLDEDVELAAVNDVAQVLQGRTAGVSVMQSGGAAGTGSRIRIRGSNSISLSNEPLIVIDGVRASNDKSSFAVGGQNLSRMNDLNAEDIESIEVLKGPAASAMYGTAAANGVVVITTKKGRAADTRFNVYTEQGNVEDVAEYPGNYLGYCSYESGGTTRTLTYCDVGTFTDPTYISNLNIRLDSVPGFSPLEDPRSTPFQTGYRGKYGISASGGSDRATYYLSADVESEDGIYKFGMSTLDRRSLRANLSGQLLENLEVAVNTGYINSEANLPQNDNNAWGVVSGALLSSSPRFEDEDGNFPLGYGFGVTPEQTSNVRTAQYVDRVIGSTTATWRPLGWLSVIGTAGLDRVGLTDDYLVPPGVFPYNATSLEGSRDVRRWNSTDYTANLGGTASYELSTAISGSSSLGVQYSEEIARGTTASGDVLVPGVPTLGGANARFSVDEFNTQVRTIGGYVQQRVNFGDRLYLTGAVRADDNSAFGNDFGLVYYPSVSASWVVHDEPFFPELNWLSTLRLRSAWGRSGLRPGALDAFRYFNPVAVTSVSGVSVPGFTVGGAGNLNLRPEKSTEFEAGLDLGIINDRLGLELTYFNKRSEDALVSRPLPPSLGIASTRRENLGAVRNSGVEALLNLDLATLPSFRWDATVSASWLRNELEDVGTNPATGEPLPPIIFGLGGDSQRHTEGRPLGAYFARPYTFSDANDDGFISPDELEFQSDTSVYVGSPFPTREVSLSSTATLFDVVRVNGLLDYRGGFQQFNSTEEFRCGVFFNCSGIYGIGSLEEQAAAVGAGYYNTIYGYVEDADFLKLRELALTLMVPTRYTEGFGTENLSLTLSGRNLATWTDYRGLDPEINFAGSGSNFSTAEFLSQPPVRYYTLRVDVSF